MKKKCYKILPWLYILVLVASYLEFSVALHFNFIMPFSLTILEITFLAALLDNLIWLLGVFLIIAVFIIGAINIFRRSKYVWIHYIIAFTYLVDSIYMCYQITHPVLEGQIESWQWIYCLVIDIFMIAFILFSVVKRKKMKS